MVVGLRQLQVDDYFLTQGGDHRQVHARFTKAIASAPEFSMGVSMGPKDLPTSTQSEYQMGKVIRASEHGKIEQYTGCRQSRGAST